MTEFNELKLRLKNNPKLIDTIIPEMRNNLISRNGGCTEYTLRDFKYPLKWDINSCTVKQLLAINNDMESKK